MEYLNEEQFKKNNQKVKTAGLIVMIIGLCLVCAAIFVLISASQMEASITKKPSVDVSGLLDVDSQDSALSWFESSVQSMTTESEARSAQMSRQSTGMFMLLPGIFITIVGCMIRFVVGNQRQIMAYQVQQGMHIAQEGMEKMAHSMGNAAKEIAKGIKEGLKDDEK